MCVSSIKMFVGCRLIYFLKVAKPMRACGLTYVHSQELTKVCVLGMSGTFILIIP